MSKLINFLKKYEEVLRYIFFGVLTTLVNFSVFYLLDTVLGKSYLIANFFSIIIAILFAYITNKIFVFQSETENIKETMKEFINFLALRLFSGVFDMLSMYLLVDGLSTDTNLAKLLTQVIVVVSNYLFSKLFIFKDKEKDAV